MSTAGQFSSRSPTIKRIMKEASELASQPLADYHAAPLESDLFEWHFTLRGPPAPSAFAGGAYHGRIVLPPAYPLKPPSFRFLTPTGRFEANREICLSISGHHEETWQPAWGIRTALVALRSFMDTDARGQVGGMDASEEVRRRLAGQSAVWKCPTCARSNADIMKEQDEEVKANGDQEAPKDELPAELRLAYREDLVKTGPDKAAEEVTPAKTSEQHSQDTTSKTTARVITPPTQSAPPVEGPVRQRALARSEDQVQTTVQSQRPPVPAIQVEGVPPWIDKAIWVVLAAIALVMFQRYCL